MYKPSILLISLVIFYLLGCSGESDKNDPTLPPQEVHKVETSFNFDSENHGWQVGFADLPINNEDFYELQSRHEQLPTPLNHLSGLLVSGNNHSDDLYMYIKKQFLGFKVNTQYEVAFDINFATNAQKECAGVGGSPGESVWIKAGVTVLEPNEVVDASNDYRMNIDKGNQSIGGSDAIVVGDFSNQQVCGSQAELYEEKNISSLASQFTVMTDATGALWLSFSTDSGFEATTSIYYISGKIVATSF